MSIISSDSLDLGVNIASFLAGSLLGWYLQRRSGSAADADLYHLSGELGREGARSFAGDDQQSLSLAANSRAALQHYRTVGHEKGQALASSIQSAYSDLAFGTLARSSELSNKMWLELHRGLGSVVTDLEALGDRRGTSTMSDLADHIHFVGQLGAAIRGRRGQAAPEGGADLNIWRCRDTGKRRRTAEHVPPTMSSRQKLDRLAVLYAEELTVIKNWDLLKEKSEQVSVTANVVEIGETGGWLAPWYLSKDVLDGKLCAVNVTNEALGDRDPGRGYELDYVEGLPTYPEPLTHGELPPSIRAEPIKNLRRLLKQQAPPVVCLLVYDIASSTARRTLVLDGNHRLAAAREMQALQEPLERSPLYAIVFHIAEAVAIDDPMSYTDDSGYTWRWRGFTPDLSLVREDAYQPTRTRSSSG